MRITRGALIVTAFLGGGATALAAELNLPPRKAGEWKIEIQAAAGKPAMETRMCLSPDIDKKLMSAGLAMRGDCSKMDVQEAGGGYIIDSECTFGAMKTKSHTQIWGDFQSKYNINVASDITGGPKMMPPHSTVTQVATWVGECTDLKPGEMEVHGMKIDALKVMGGG